MSGAIILTAIGSWCLVMALVVISGNLLHPFYKAVRHG